MKDSTLHALAPLLNALRGYSVLDEVRPAAFELHGRDFIHFHESGDGVIADVILARGRVRLPVSTNEQQAELLETVEPRLDSLESRSTGRKQRRRKRRSRDS